MDSDSEDEDWDHALKRNNKSGSFKSHTWLTNWMGKSGPDKAKSPDMVKQLEEKVLLEKQVSVTGRYSTEGHSTF